MSTPSSPLVVVTATTDERRAALCMHSWRAQATGDVRYHTVINGLAGDYYGTVPAFRRGIDDALALYPEAELFACLHDDVEILEDGWDVTVRQYFARHPSMGLAGFGGAIALGSDDLYQTPYDPMQLVRSGFRSNLVNAETHGGRSLLAERVACLDGFSQIGRRDFWEGADGRTGDPAKTYLERPWTVLESLGFVHHFYDGALGCLAARYGWETWYLPIRCHHYGGQTAVGDPGYQRWAAAQVPGGDQGFWTEAHRLGWTHFRDVLPLRV